ncbi:hypothetical protein LY76DRAFT_31555 [Colletotrichum caudatum]|nr:hypothetical protein LY76DRAFT_31555 [Colletotrichum caudatum]
MEQRFFSFCFSPSPFFFVMKPPGTISFSHSVARKIPMLLLDSQPPHTFLFFIFYCWFFLRPVASFAFSLHQACILARTVGGRWKRVEEGDGHGVHVSGSLFRAAVPASGRRRRGVVGWERGGRTPPSRNSYQFPSYFFCVILEEIGSAGSGGAPRPPRRDDG